ncbi:MAG: thioredoxin [Halofilum sp. (in: g-proteobacteria)]
MAVVDLTQENLESTIREHDIVLVDFWAEWCGPCKSFAPTYEKVAESHPDIAFGKVNIEEQEEVAQTFGIRSIPTLAIFREQTLIMLEAGAMAESTLEQAIEQVRALDMAQVREDLKQRTEESQQQEQQTG